MLESLFAYPAVVARHRAAPLLGERERFLTRCSQRGYTAQGLRKIAWMLLVISRSIPAGRRKVRQSEIERGARRHTVRFLRHKAGRGNCATTQRMFRHLATTWFGYLGKLAPEEPSRGFFDAQVEAFERFMREERGLSEVTILSRRQRVGHFLGSLPSRVRSVRQITVADIDRYLIQQSGRGWSRRSLAVLAASLRSFFRYIEGRHGCKAGLAAAIASPRIYSDEGLPRGPDWDAVQRLIASATGNTPMAMRDRAILMLLAVYGFRRGEVARLCLEDIEWDQEVLRVVRPKQRRVQRYPLTRPVGNAVVQYLRQVRPRCAYREIFLAMKAPMRPLSPGTITSIVRRRLSRLGVHVRGCGPHGLRHACARHLLEQGFSLKQIGDQLGHRRASTTLHYAKIDLRSLRQVAELNLRDLL
jgi:site-specific recombinase XerD